MREFISNIVELSFISLGYEDEIKYHIDTAMINILRTSDYKKYINFANSS